jgi:hypothetical protein
MPLSQEDFESAAEKLGVETAAIKAVDHVESNGDGFLESGEPKILFEAHWFSRLTGGKYDESHPNISSPQWDRSLYKGGQEEHTRLQEATNLDRKAALQSASWGRYQILGINWDKCGYNNVQYFINDMYDSEAEHLGAFVSFIKNEGLADALREKNWHAFAREYNGPGYERNDYAYRMKRAYEQYS